MSSQPLKGENHWTRLLFLLLHPPAHFSYLFTGYQNKVSCSDSRFLRFCRYAHSYPVRSPYHFSLILPFDFDKKKTIHS